MTLNYDKRVALYARAVIKGERAIESIKNPIIRAEVAKVVAARQSEGK